MTITRRVLPLGAGDGGDLGSTRLQMAIGGGERPRPGPEGSSPVEEEAQYPGGLGEAPGANSLAAAWLP